MTKRNVSAPVAVFNRLLFLVLFAVLATLSLTTNSYADSAVGATPGQFAVTNSGRASYTIPLSLPPGINGVKPSLALRYNSGRGNGLLGVGWSLSGFPVIHRCNQTIAENGQAYGVDYSQTDRLCFNGSQLRAVSGGYWNSGTVYRTAREHFVRITQHGSHANIWFEVEYKNGNTAEFGNTTDSAINAASGSGIDAIRLWAINKLADPNGNAIVYSYTEVVGDGSYRPDRIIYTKHASAGGFYAVNFNYDASRPDPVIAYFAGAERSQHARLKDITITTASGVNIRRYTVAYKTDGVTGKSQVIAITECAGTSLSACFKPTTFSGQAAASGALSSVQSYSASTDYPRSSARTADINHDGIADLLYVYGTGDYAQVVVRLGRRSGALSSRISTGLHPFALSSYPAETNRQWYVVHLDQDGRPALLSHTKGIGGTNTGVLYRYIGGQFIQQTIAMPAVVGWSTGARFKFADLDNDGRDDIVYLADGVSSDDTLGIIWRTENGWTQGVETKLPFSVTHVAWPDKALPAIDHYNTLKIIDMNNDERPEILLQGSKVYDACGDGTCPYYYRTGSYQLHLTSSGWQVQSIPAAVNSNSVLADINGDGYPDLANVYNAYLNNGQYPAKQVATHAPAYNWPIAVDLDGDGASELLYPNEPLPKADPDIPPEEWDTYTDPDSDTYSIVRFSGGSFSQPSTIWIDAPNVWPDAPQKGALQAADFNGDGLDDLWTDLLTVRMNTGKKKIAVTSITNGFGTQWQVAYTPLTNPAVYTPGNDDVAYPRQHYAGARQVVEYYIVDDGVGGTYRAEYQYAGAEVNVNGRGFLGFAKRTVTDSRKSGIEVIEQFYQQYPRTGVTRYKALIGPDGGPISETFIHPDKRVWGSGYQQRVLVYPKEVETKSYRLDNGALLKTTTKTLSNLDAWGNPEAITTTTTGGGKTYTTTKTVDYLNNGNTWCLGQPLSTSITRSIPGDSHTQTTTSVVDPTNCRVTSKTLQASGSNPAVKTTYDYDSWGNVSGTTIGVPGVAGVVARTTTSDYRASNGRFPTQTVNAAGHVTTLGWDPRLGVKKSVTGPNGLTTRFGYDAFGRLIETDYPDARLAQLSYSWCGSDNCGVEGGQYQISQYLAKSQALSADALTVYGAFGRELMTGSRGLRGEWTYQFTIYNSLGQVVRVSQPHQTGGQLDGSQIIPKPADALTDNLLINAETFTTEAIQRYWTLYQHDLLGRVITIQHPYNSQTGAGGGQTRISYEGFTTRTTNAKDQVTVKVKNALGQTVAITDALGNTTHYAHDAAGNLTETTDPLGNVVRMGYDNRGNKIAMTDPDMGHWTYDYNAFGELTKQTDAKGQITRMFYDTLGRLKKRIEGVGGSDEVTTQWFYDSAAHGIGKLASVTQSTGFEKAIGYDGLSRPFKSTVTIGGVPYVTSKDYNEYSQVTAIHYPASVAVSNDPVQVLARIEPLEALPGSTFTLDGSQSTGSDTYQTLSYHWTQVNGPSVTINAADNAIATVTPTTAGEYVFKLTVSDGFDTAAATVSFTVKPYPPRNLSISDGSISDGEFLLTWDSPEYGLPIGGEYFLYQFDDEIYSGTEQEYLVSVNADGTWSYAVKVCVQSLCSAKVSASTMVYLKPGKPAAPTIAPSPSPDGDYLVSWDEPGSGVPYTNYRLTETSSGATWTLAPNERSKPFYGKKDGAQLSYAIQVCNGQICSEESGESTVRIVIEPKRPSSISVPNTSTDDSERISWGSPDGVVDFYRLQEATNTSFSPKTDEWTTSQRSQIVPVSGNKRYYYRVQACTRAGGVDCGPWRTDTTGLRHYETPGAPSSITADGAWNRYNENTTVTVTWGEAAGVQTRYELYRRYRYFDGRSDAYSDWQLVQSSNSRSFSETQSPTPIRLLVYRVRACNGPACSGYETSGWVDVADPNPDPGDCIIICPGSTALPATARSRPFAAPALRSGQGHGTEQAHFVKAGYTPGGDSYPPARLHDAVYTPAATTRASRRQGRLLNLAEGGSVQLIARARLQKTGYTSSTAGSFASTGDDVGERFTVEYVYGIYGHLIKVVNYHKQDQVYWEAKQADGYGHLTESTLGNGITTERYYDPATGSLTGIASGPGAGPHTMTGCASNTTDIQCMSYRWDRIGNLTQRTNTNRGLTEAFHYDGLNRLRQATLNNQQILKVDYNAIGNIQSKTGADGIERTYAYGVGQSQGIAGIHAVTAVGGVTYHYDANGNMTDGAGRTITWNAANYPVTLTQGAVTKTITYGPAQQRYYQTTRVNGTLTETTLTIGLFQRIQNHATGVIRYQHSIRARGKTIAIYTRTSNDTQSLQYLHRGHLGSVVAVTNAIGEVTARMSYTAFGARRQLDGTGTAPNPLPDIDRGYTGQQMLDNVNLIHMNGRVYAPTIGRFLSADPHVPHPYNGQSYNRYAYVLNNPLTLVDPSGFVDKDAGHQQACGPDLDCDGMLTNGEQRMAEDICSWGALDGRCGTWTDGKGLFWTVEFSEVEQLISNAEKRRRQPAELRLEVQVRVEGEAGIAAATIRMYVADLLNEGKLTSALAKYKEKHPGETWSVSDLNKMNWIIHNGFAPGQTCDVPDSCTAGRFGGRFSNLSVYETADADLYAGAIKASRSLNILDLARFMLHEFRHGTEENWKIRDYRPKYQDQPHEIDARDFAREVMQYYVP